MAAKSLNKNNAAIKRIMQEAKELANDPSTDYSAAPLEDDIFEWHCTLRGPAGTEFEGGLYHFRILLPAEYPFRPPSLMMLTPNGRFELNTKICISFTNYHEELWQPAWGVRTAILGLQGFFPLKGQQAVGVGSVEYPPAERKRLAILSREWVCPECKQTNLDLLPHPLGKGRTCSETRKPEASDGAPSIQPSAVVGSTMEPEKEECSSEVGDLQMKSDRKLNERHTALPSPAVGARQALAIPSHSREPSSDAADVIRTTRHKAHKAPLLLDTAICVLLVLAFALICRRVI